MEYGVDYYQPGAPFEKAANLNECIDKCHARDGCSHFSFAWGVCWFKTSSQGYILNEYLISGNVIDAPRGTPAASSEQTLTQTIERSDFLQHLLLNPRFNSAQTCTELGWQPRTSSPEVCGQSAPLGTCHVANIEYRAAMATCNAIGGRLCSANELNINGAKDTGCDLDNKAVWTSDKCGVDMFLVAKGSRNSRSSPVCTHMSESNSLRCCADAVLELPPKPAFEVLSRTSFKELRRGDRRIYKKDKKSFKQSLRSWKRLRVQIKAAIARQAARVVGQKFEAINTGVAITNYDAAATERKGGWSTIGMVATPIVFAVLCAIVALIVRARRTRATSLATQQPLNFAASNNANVQVVAEAVNQPNTLLSLQHNLAERSRLAEV
jgi:hypothetical protein